MWSRKELKEKARRCVSLNYWKMVLAALLLTVVCGGGSSVSSFGGAAAGLNSDDDSEYEYSQEHNQEEWYYEDGTYYEDEEMADLILEDGIDVFLIVFVIVILLVLLIVFLVMLPLDIFVLNPLSVGIRRFFVKNLKEPAQMKEICYAFDHGYKNCVKTEFFRKLYIFLWLLLLIVPGIIKSYEYQMVPYILGEQPDLEKERVFELSKTMMYGNKWKAFVLDLSFLGWYLLNGITLGILGIFYLNPYVEQTGAALYQTLKVQYLQNNP